MIKKFKVGDKVLWHNELFVNYMSKGIVLSEELDDCYMIKWLHSTSNKSKIIVEIRKELGEELFIAPPDGNDVLKGML